MAIAAVELAALFGRAEDRGPAAERLEIRVHTSEVAHGTTVAPCRAGDVDNRRVDAGDRRIVDAQASGNAGTKILDEDVTRFQEIVGMLPTGVLLQIQHDRA